MVLNWYSQDELFKPYEFKKTERVSFRDWWRLAKDGNVRSLYLSKYAGSTARMINKLPYFRIKRRGS